MGTVVEFAYAGKVKFVIVGAVASTVTVAVAVEVPIGFVTVKV
jgi:hypothetical protein